MPDASILIVEDESIVAEDLARKLRRLGYGVAGITEFGEKSLALAHELRPRLVLMDIRLGGAMDGVEAAERIRQECDVPVIYLTASSDRATIDRAKVTEPFGYILKPFEDRELESHIEMALYKHEAERKLRESEERFRLAAVAAHAMVYDVDVRTKRMSAMSGLKGLLGYDESEAESSPDWWDGRIHPDDLAMCRAAFQKMSADCHDRAMEYRLMHKDGRTLFVEDHATPVCDNRGQLIRIVGTVVDITGRKRAESELKKANSELRYFNELMIGRELRMVELKKEVDELCRQCGQPSRYGYETAPSPGSTP
jgi:two-component system, cell cycle sensor histidine kinase and response regulator CckA